MGVEKFRDTVEGYFGKAIAPYKPLPVFKYQDYLGWNEQGDGKLFLGISIENGRVKDEGTLRLKTALREVVKQFGLPMRLTPNHNVIIYEVDPSQQQALEQLLDQHGVPVSPDGIDPLVRYSMACPALPTCGLAITESERIIPEFLDRIRALLAQVGLEDEEIVIRMTGCPNGCARPYMAELGFVGSAPETYQVWLGGSPDQTRLAQAYTDRMLGHELESLLEPIFAYFKQERKPGEMFGDFCDRVGLEALREFTITYQSPTLNSQSDTGLVNEVVPPEPSTVFIGGKTRYRIGVRDELYGRLKDAAAKQGKTMTQLAAEALDAYLKGNSHG